MSTVAPTALPDALGDASREFVSKQHDLLIGQERLQAADGRTFATFDPSSGAEIANVPQAGAEDVNRAVAAARAAFEQGPWASMAPSERSRLINALADALEQRQQEIAEIESLDNGKPVKLARFVDVLGTVAHLRYFAGWATKIEGSVLPVTAPGMLCYTRREPVGVCGQIVPWNFPLLMASWKVAPALAAGCTIVLKPAEQTPLSALRLGELALEVGFPPGVLNVITGDGETGAALVDHPGVEKISFTGSTVVGREIGAKAGRALKRVTLELGGKSPNVILPDADIDAAVKGSYQAIYFNSGQACNAGSRLFVPKERFDEVVAALAERAQATRLGAGLDPDTQLGPLVSAEQQERVMSYIDSGREQGAELLSGGAAALQESGGWYVQPTLFASTSDELKIAREEIFGPVLVASPYDSLEEVASRANAGDYGLAAGVWTKDVGSAHRLAAMLRAGSVYINHWGGSDPAAPFGGFKASGVGREHGRDGLEGYLETKTVWTSLA
ncbi:MAG TPA: aldehyde dehydrogenase family protein [Solirubrobacteraceae bacterium]|nr:aldehyde dehydrogenase family protein [Solirubrobacteraceae bacterium]